MPPINELADLTRPMGQAALLLAVGVLLLCFRCYRTGSVSCVLAVLWMFLCTTQGFTSLLRQGLESGYSPIEAAQYPVADAIVVLGGGYPLQLKDANIPVGDLRSTRAGFGLALFRQGRAPVVLLSGGGSGEAHEMASHLEQLGVPASNLRVEDRSLTTNENALYSAAILKREGRHRILLITSAWAMPRASASFRRQGVDVIPAPSFDRLIAPSSRPTWQENLSQSGRFLHEYLGLLFYKLRGWA